MSSWRLRSRWPESDERVSGEPGAIHYELEKICGPDVTELWVDALADAMSGTPLHAAGSLGWGNITGGRFDEIKNRIKLYPDCPTRSCTDHIWMCDGCIEYTFPGNLVLGLLGGVAGISLQRLLWLSQQDAELEGSGTDSAADQAAIKYGHGAHKSAQKALAKSGVPAALSNLSDMDQDLNSISEIVGAFKAYGSARAGFDNDIKKILCGAIKKAIDDGKIKARKACNKCSRPAVVLKKK